MLFADHLDLNKLELRKPVLENLASAPASPVKGQFYFDTGSNKLGVYNGTGWDYAGSGGVTSVSGTAPISSTGGAAPTISIAAASGSTAGSMSIADFNKLATSTAANTASTLVQRDSSGNFVAGTITANLTGTASNSSQLNGQAAAFYQARANHTGTQSSSTISDFDTQVRTNTLNQMAAPTSALGMNGQLVSNVAIPVGGNDAATKAYVDGLVATGNNKGTARAAATTNINLAAPGAAIDGVTLASGDIVLLTGQSTASQNGLYVWNGAGATLTRTTNADTSAEVAPGLFVYVAEGTANGSNGYTLVTPAPITVGTTGLTFTQTSGAGQITAGSGLTKNGNVLNVGAGTGIVVNADDIALDTAIAARKFGQQIGDGSTVAITVTHNLNNLSPIWNVSQSASPFQAVIPTVSHPTANTTTFTFAVAPTPNQYRVTLIG